MQRQVIALSGWSAHAARVASVWRREEVDIPSPTLSFHLTCPLTESLELLAESRPEALEVTASCNCNVGFMPGRLRLLRVMSEIYFRMI
jgi:hypothetical protein